jgi:hypothetical protein
MHLASDYIHPTPRGGRCRVRVYLPEDEREASVVVCTELPTNQGPSINYAAEQLAAEVIRYHRLPTPVVWIEHHPPTATGGFTETFDLMDFSSYEVRERAPYMGETRLTVGEATWKRITRYGRDPRRRGGVGHGGQRPPPRDHTEAAREVAHGLAEVASHISHLKGTATHTYGARSDVHLGPFSARRRRGR